MYNDIINLQHHESLKHPKMSIEQRCAQFMPFAALTGYGDEIKNEARLTYKKIILDDEYKEILDNKINLIESIKDTEKLKITYFIKDNIKIGGKYVEKEDYIKKIDRIKKIVIMQDNTIIKINDILNIESPTINNFNEKQ